MIEALAEPVRRRLVERLVEGPAPVTELARELPVSRSAVSQHLQVLKRAQLVTDRPLGTRRIYQVDPEALALLRTYFESFWSRSLLAFRDFSETEQERIPDDSAR
jgi:DNA-binding transcriptional ArsR family regulator